MRARARRAGGQLLAWGVGLRSKMVVVCAAGLALGLLACGPRPIAGQEQGESSAATTSTGDETQTSSPSGATMSTTSNTAGSEDTDEPTDDPTDEDTGGNFVPEGEDGEVPCMCEAGESCVSGSYGCHWDDDAMPSVSCVDTPAACAEPWSCAEDDPCVRELCGPWRRCAGTSCDDAPGAELVCEHLIGCFHPHSFCASGYKCTPTSSATGSAWEYVGCIEAPGEDPPGAACVREVPVSPDSCDAGSVCWTADVSDTPKPATCRQLCGPRADISACPVGQHCLDNIDGQAEVGVCLDSCDPLAPSCEPGLDCVFTSTHFVCMEIAKLAAAGQPCGWVNDCAAGNLCVGAESVEGCMGSSCCTPICDLDEPDSCMGPLTCEALVEGLAGVGSCVLPGSEQEFPERVATGL